MDITKHTLTVTKTGDEVYLYHPDDDKRYFIVTTDLPYCEVMAKTLSGARCEVYMGRDGFIAIDTSKYEREIIINYKTTVLTVNVRDCTIAKVKYEHEESDLQDDDLYFLGMVESEYDRIHRELTKLMSN